MFISARVFVPYLRHDFLKTLGCKNVSISTEYKQKVNDYVRYFITSTRSHFPSSLQLDSLRSSTDFWFLPFSFFCLQMSMAFCVYSLVRIQPSWVLKLFIYLPCLTKNYWATWKRFASSSFWSSMSISSVEVS